MRYLGQEHTVNVPFPAGDVTAQALDQVRASFHVQHEHLYTYRLPASIEFVTFHVTATVAVAKPTLQPIGARGDGQARERGTRPVNFDAAGIIETPIYERASLGPGATINGPAIIEEPASTTVVFPTQQVRVDDYGNLVITTGAEA